MTTPNGPTAGISVHALAGWAPRLPFHMPVVTTVKRLLSAKAFRTAGSSSEVDGSKASPKDLGSAAVKFSTKNCTWHCDQRELICVTVWRARAFWTRGSPEESL